MIQPKGFEYLEFEIKMRQSHKKPDAIIKTKISDSNPRKKMEIILPKSNEDCVIGWQSNTIRKTKLIERYNKPNE